MWREEELNKGKEGIRKKLKEFVRTGKIKACLEGCYYAENTGINHTVNTIISYRIV